MRTPSPQPARSDEIDEAMLADAAHGDPHAWRMIEDHLWRRVELVLGRHSPDIGDVVQDICIKIVTALENDRGPGFGGASAAGWVMRIARNTAIDHWRKQTRWDTRHICVGVRAEPALDPVVEASIDREDMMALKDVVSSLSDEHRIVLALRYVERCTFSEIATLLGIPENTVKSRATRALEKLREDLEIEKLGRFTR